MKRNLIVLLLSLLSANVNGQDYREIRLGDQVWMAENLNIVRFRNGDTIPEARSDEEWINAGKNKQPAWCYYDNDSANCLKYGRLYNWFAVNDPRGLAPDGWHVPSLKEWDSLQNALGTDAGKKMKSTTSWRRNGNGSNESGFTGLPGGLRYYNGTFTFQGFAGAWWSSDEPTEVKGTWGRGLVFYDSKILTGYDGRKDAALSVRCVKNGAAVIKHKP